jgi:hypothetical protein
MNVIRIHGPVDFSHIFSKLFALKQLFKVRAPSAADTLLTG